MYATIKRRVLKCEMKETKIKGEGRKIEKRKGTQQETGKD
jgi:hypothetical protein